MRVTTNAILRNYKSNLATSLKNLNLDRDKVMTQRNFTASAQNPAGALRAANLERKYVRNQDYLQNVKDAQSFQDAQEDAAMQISTQAIKLSKQYGLEAWNGTNQSQDIRETYAKAFEQAQKSMVASLNATYEDKYVLGGADGGNPPFDLKDGKLTYRGLEVSDPANTAILDELANEHVYMDLGFGLDIQNGSIVDATAFDTSLPGIKLVGYGVDANGTPKNMVDLAGKIAECLRAPGELDDAEYEKLLNAFDQGRKDILNEVTTLGTQTEYLTITKDRLDTNRINLYSQLDSVTGVDMAEAIMNFSWSQYAYNAALKVGTQILSPSFIDFMD